MPEPIRLAEFQKRVFGELERWLLDEGAPAVLLIAATGTGKTSLSIAFAHKHRNRFSRIVRRVASAAPQLLGPREESLKLAAPSFERGPHDDLPVLQILDEAHYWTPEQLMELVRPSFIMERRLQTLVISQRIISTLPANVPRLYLGRAEESLSDVASQDPKLARLLGEARKLLTDAELEDATTAGVIENAQAALLSFQQPGLIGLDGAPIQPGSAEQHEIVQASSRVNEELLMRLERTPSLLYDLPSRLFEELVADLLSKQGYEVELTPASRDGGKDIYVARKTDLGYFLFLVECKKYAPDSPVGVQVVRELYGVVQAEKATAGIIATTSHFTKPAVEFQRTVQYQLALQDYFAIQKWIRIVNQRGRL